MLPTDITRCHAQTHGIIFVYDLGMTRIYIYALLLAALCMSSCSRYYYKPNAVNAPLLHRSQDLHVTVAGGDGGFNGMAAYSPVSHLGIIGGFSTWRYKADSVNFTAGDVDASATLAELGAGYYNATGGKVAFIYDVYGGIGIGGLRSDVDLNALRIFVQPGVGLRTPWFDCAVSVRMCDLKYTNLDANGRGDAYLRDHKLIDVNGGRIDGKHYIFAEPAITLRGGYKFIKLQMQYVFSSAVSNVPWQYTDNTLTLGLNFQLEDLLNMEVKSK